MYQFRPATLEDAQAINDIYNDAIETTNATFDTVAKPLSFREQWLAVRQANHPVLVAEEDDRVVGWASLNSYDARDAYRRTAEISIYIDNEARGKGLGRDLMDAILAAGRDTELLTVIARITVDNEASIRLHENAGFQKVGVLKGVGEKFGQLLDVSIMQRTLTDG
jgi:phosphinothricin acetyltransferase